MTYTHTDPTQWTRKPFARACICFTEIREAAVISWCRSGIWTICYSAGFVLLYGARASSHSMASN